ncbi:hypothetical protein RCL49_24365, partial [Salmonella enterica subsp. enterica serovar Typhimurium]|nr:hypothetical protein [Salmonella enterica]MCR2148575.1 hypothetical protein [Salmonella enterica]MCR2167035.1 hypothetical protein [Salmonella enterica]MCR2180888.1 hypothetical protein [Salmonella enterica]
ADRNRSHWRTSKTPSYTKSVSWQHHQKDDLITRCKLLKGERDESIFTILIGIVVKLGLVGLAFYLLLGSTIDWSSWKTYAAMLILGAFL